MIKKIGYGIFFCFLWGVFFFILFQWQELNRFYNQVGLRYREGALSVEQIEEYTFREKEEQVEVTAWKMEKGESIIWEEAGRRAEGTVLKVYGNMVRVLPFSLKYGGFTFYGDTSGCIISSGLAWKLFGAENVTGNVIFYDEKEWQVRGILDMKEPVLALYQQEKQERMSYVELWTEEESPAPKLEQIKSSLGLFGESYIFTGSFYWSIGRILLHLPFWFIFFYICRTFGRWTGKIEKSSRKWISIAGKILLSIVFIGGIYHTISFTEDFVPVQWSDFGFWKEKGDRILSGVYQRKQFPEIYWEQQVIIRVKKIAVGVVILIAQIFLIVNKKLFKYFSEF